MYRVEVISDYEQLWRYNVVLTCGGYSALSEQLYVVGCERITSEEFQTGATEELVEPVGFVVGEPLVLECDAADNIHLILYVIAHTLPLDREVESSPPFPIRLTIQRDGVEIYEKEHEVNQWGGVTVNVKI